VYCCESSLALCEVARECIRINGLEGRITVLNKLSFDLSDEDLGGLQVQVVVTELVDSGLLGEHLIEVGTD
jgi:hypothetical protein